MKWSRLVLASLLALSAPSTLSACDAEAEVVAVRVASFGADGGVDMTTGAVQVPGNFANSDLFASANGGHLKLATGSDKPTTNRPVNWFIGAGGVAATFAGLDDVPDDRPDAATTQALPHAKTGNGFVLMTSRGTWFKGFIREATATQITVEYGPL